MLRLSRFLPSLWIALATTLFVVSPGTLLGQDPADSARPSDTLLMEFEEDPLGFYFDLRTNEAIQCGQVILSDPDYPEDGRQRTLVALAAIYTASGREAQARAAFNELIGTNPRRDLNDPARLPPPVVQLFYTVRDSLLLATGRTLPLDIKTVAIGQIENNSIVKGKYDLDRFARGLQQILITDLMDATPLKVVDRQRLDVLISEIGMTSNQDIFNPAYAVKFGELSGAQSFIFGSLFQVDEKKIRFDLRWVDTSTSEIILSEGVEVKLGKADDLFKLEQKVLMDLVVPGMLAALEGQVDKKALQKDAKEYLDRKKKSKSNLAEGTDYVDILLATGEALLAEDRGDLVAARASWDQVRAMDPNDARASDRAQTLHAYLDLSDADSRK